MKTGTKSLLFGVHQFIWHPITVCLAWRKLEGHWPSFKEFICIIIHDWGYWGCENMDDEKGEQHPLYGARLAHRFLGEEYHDLILYHSRHLAKKYKQEPSKLCWPDKLSILYEPWWLYLPRAWASGELFEYREISSHLFPIGASHREWHKWITGYMNKIGNERRGDVVPYMKQGGKKS